MQHKYKINEFIQNFVLLFMHKKVIKCWTLIQIHIDILNITKKNTCIIAKKIKNLIKHAKIIKSLHEQYKIKKKLKQNSE